MESVHLPSNRIDGRPYVYYTDDVYSRVADERAGRYTDLRNFLVKVS